MGRPSLIVAASAIENAVSFRRPMYPKYAYSPGKELENAKQQKARVPRGLEPGNLRVPADQACHSLVSFKAQDN